MIRKIHQIWLDFGNGTQLPEKYKKNQEMWKKHHPGWELKLWKEKEIKQLLTRYPFLMELYSSFCYPVMKVDFIRLLILYDEGGLYVDTDSYPQKSLEPYIAKYVSQGKKLFFSRTGTLNRHVSNFILYSSEPRHIFWRQVINNIEERRHTPNFHKVFYVCYYTGPLVLSFTNEKYIGRDVHIFPKKLFNPCFGKTRCIAPKEALVVHSFDENWHSSYFKTLQENFKLILVIVIFIIIFVLWYFSKKN